MPRLLVALDFDGTLVPLRARPGHARLDAATRDVLARLDARGARVAILSGRSLADLERRVGLPGLAYGGVFGLEAAEPGWRWVHPRARAARPALARLARDARRAFAGLPGVQVEDKGAGLSLHYRRVPVPRRRDFARRLRALRADAPVGLVWRRGKRAWEVTPAADWDKGRALRLLWERADRPRLLAIGDDESDEPMLAFAARRGEARRVGRGRSAARARLRGPAQVRAFLRRLAADLGATPGPGTRYNVAARCPPLAAPSSPRPSAISAPAAGR